MAKDRTKIIAATASLYVAPIGSTVPDFTVSPLVLDVAWIDVGYTDKGVALDYAPTFKGAQADQVLGDLKKFITNENAKITTNLKEATLIRMNQAIAASTLTTQAPAVGNVGSKTLVGGGNPTPAEVMVLIVGSSPEGSGFFRAIIGWRAMSVAQVKLAFTKDSETMIPIEFDLMPDDTKAAGQQLYKWVDMTAPHS